MVSRAVRDVTCCPSVRHAIRRLLRHPFVVPSIAICRLSRCPLSIVASIRRPIHVVRRVFSIRHVAMCCRLPISNWWFLIIRKINLYIIIFGLQTYFTNPKTLLNQKKGQHG